MIEARTIHLEPEAVMAMSQILGIMLDQMFDAETSTMWNTEHIIELEARLVAPAEGEPVEMGIDDASLLLQGMAFTEVMSADLPWIDMVRWVTDFVTTELRQHWTEEEWHTFSQQCQKVRSVTFVTNRTFCSMFSSHRYTTCVRVNGALLSS